MGVGLAPPAFFHHHHGKTMTDPDFRAPLQLEDGTWVLLARRTPLPGEKIVLQRLKFPHEGLNGSYVVSLVSNTTTMTTPTLAPCPFCGSIDVELFDQAPDEWGYFYIRCHKCQATGPHIDYDPKQGEEFARSEAATTWNQRSAPVTPADPPSDGPSADLHDRVRALVQGLADRYSQNLPPTP